MQGMENTVNKTSKAMAKDLADAFNITDTKAIGEIEDAAKKLTQAMSVSAQTGKSEVSTEMFNQLYNSLEKGIQTVKVYDSEMKEFLKTVQATGRIKISPEVMSSLGDEWKNLDGMLKQKLSTTVGTELDSLIEEWKNQFSGIFSNVGDDFNLNTVEDQLRYVDKVLSDARSGVQAYEADAQDMWNAIVEGADKAQEAIEKVNEQTKQTNGTNTVGFDTTTMKEIISMVNGISTKGTDNLVKIKDSLVEFVSGLNTVGSINFDVSGLKGVFNAINTLSKESSTTAISNLKNVSSQLKTAVEQINSAGNITFDITGLNTFANTVNKLGGKQISKTMSNLPQLTALLQNFIATFNDIGAMSFDTTNLTNLVAAISKLGSTASGRATTNIPILAENLKQLFVTLSTAPEVSSNILSMTQALAQLATSVKATGASTSQLSSGLNLFGKSATKATKKTNSLAAAFGKFYATYWLILRAFSKLSDAIDISSDLTEVQNVVDVTFGNMASVVEDFTENSIQQFGMSELAAKQYASRFQAMGSAMGISSNLISKANSFLNEQTNGYVELSDSLSSVSMNLTKLTADMASFYNVEQADVAEDLESIFTGTTRPLTLAA
jgi:2-keto-3-deoxy-L-rhamnonate aldolase RhmA